MEEKEGNSSEGRKICDRRNTEGAGGVGNEQESQGFDWAGFFRNRTVMVQAFLYVLLFYKTAPGHHDVSFLLLWLLLVPMCILNLMGTHLWKGLAAKHMKQV